MGLFLALLGLGPLVGLLMAAFSLDTPLKFQLGTYLYPLPDPTNAHRPFWLSYYIYICVWGHRTADSLLAPTDAPHSNPLPISILFPSHKLSPYPTLIHTKAKGKAIKIKGRYDRGSLGM